MNKKFSPENIGFVTVVTKKLNINKPSAHKNSIVRFMAPV